jgi:hypothetical protein
MILYSITVHEYSSGCISKLPESTVVGELNGTVVYPIARVVCHVCSCARGNANRRMGGFV